jgi:hypothetical protein
MLDKRLKMALGTAADAHRIHDRGIRPRRYTLTLMPNAIRFLTDFKE